MKKFSVLIAVLIGLLSWSAPTSADGPPSGPTVLTVVGAVSKPNRPSFDPFADAFLRFHDVTFDRAFAFDRAALEALPQVRVVARADGWPKAVTATGPKLRDVMNAAGVPRDSRVTLSALDGYAVELESTDRAETDWVLAIAVDGRSLGLGGRGPAWLLRDTGATTVSTDVEAQWVWSVFLIVAD